MGSAVSPTLSGRSSVTVSPLPLWKEVIPLSLQRKYPKELADIEENYASDVTELDRELWIETYAAYNCAQIVSFLLDNFPDLPIGDALFFAADRNFPEIAYEILKRSKADTPAMSKAYEIAIDKKHLAALAEIAIAKTLSPGCIHDLVNIAKEGDADFLIGFILLFQEEEFPLSNFKMLLETAAYYGRLSVIEKLCMYVRLHWSTRAELIGMTARYGHISSLEFLLNLGPIPDSKLTSAIQYGSFSQNERIVPFLEEKRRESLALEKAQKKMITDYFEVSLCSISENPSFVFNKVKEIPIDVLKAVFIHLKISKNDLLILAAEHNRVDIMQTFVETQNEFQYNQQFTFSDSYLFSDKAFQRAFQVAVENGFREIATILSKYRRPPLGGNFYKSGEGISPLKPKSMQHLTSAFSKLTV